MPFGAVPHTLHTPVRSASVPDYIPRRANKVAECRLLSTDPERYFQNSRTSTTCAHRRPLPGSDRGSLPACKRLQVAAGAAGTAETPSAAAPGISAQALKRSAQPDLVLVQEARRQQQRRFCRVRRCSCGSWAASAAAGPVIARSSAQEAFTIPYDAKQSKTTEVPSI
ncbi:hypothetical protein CF319_g8906 [Tilletia indica]|nr:hypothetical protein CF319_g8906 [Tilletia indica]KAE8218734.1 hypothetical protein CF326_g9101 [Tilletia indica]